MKYPKGQKHNLSKRQITWIKILALFWRYAAPFLLLLLGCQIGIILSHSKTGAVIGMASEFIFLGLYLYVGYRARWRHIYCFYQDVNREAMTPDHCAWDTLEKKDVVGLPIVLILLGIIVIIIQLIIQ